MKITIKETGEIKELVITGTNGIEWTNDLLGNNGVLTWNKETEQHEMSQDDFDWWKEYIDNYEDDTLRAEELAIDLGIEVSVINERIAEAMEGYNDLDMEHLIKLNVFEEMRNEG